MFAQLQYYQTMVEKPFTNAQIRSAFHQYIFRAYSIHASILYHYGQRKYRYAVK